MADLESTRPGWVLRGLGAFFMLLAIGLVTWDFIDFNWIWPVNIVTSAAGAFNWHLGTKRIERPGEQHEFMERNRGEIARLRGEPS